MLGGGSEPIESATLVGTLVAPCRDSNPIRISTEQLCLPRGSVLDSRGAFPCCCFLLGFVFKVPIDTFLYFLRHVCDSQLTVNVVTLTRKVLSWQFPYCVITIVG